MTGRVVNSVEAPGIGIPMLENEIRTRSEGPGSAT
jgi:hypothetical protein